MNMHTDESFFPQNDALLKCIESEHGAKVAAELFEEWQLNANGNMQSLNQMMKQAAWQYGGLEGLTWQNDPKNGEAYLVTTKNKANALENAIAKVAGWESEEIWQDFTPDGEAVLRIDADIIGTKEALHKLASSAPKLVQALQEATGRALGFTAQQPAATLDELPVDAPSDQREAEIAALRRQQERVNHYRDKANADRLRAEKAGQARGEIRANKLMQGPLGRVIQAQIDRHEKEGLSPTAKLAETAHEVHGGRSR